MKKPLHLVYGGMLTAVSLVLLLLASIWPAWSWGLCMAAGMLPAIPLARGEVRTGLLIYLATGLLALALVPAKRYAIAYVLLLGIYPMIKYRIERIRLLPLEWACKLLYAGAVFALVVGLIHLGLVPLGQRFAHLPWLLLLCVFLLAFACYDIVFSRIIMYFRVFFAEDRYNKDKKG